MESIIKNNKTRRFIMNKFTKLLEKSVNAYAMYFNAEYSDKAPVWMVLENR